MSVDVNRIAFAQKQYRTTDAIEDTSVYTTHPLATEYEYGTWMSLSSDAVAFGQFIRGLRKLDRYSWAAYINKANYPALEVGQTIRVYYPRFGFDNGVEFIVKRVKTDSNAIYDELSLFGPRTSLLPEEYDFYMDFTSQKYATKYNLMASLASMPGYSYSRTGTELVQSSTGISSFAANSPPITDKGLWSYEPTTNSSLQSQAIDNASWTKGALTVTANSSGTLDPLGTNTAEKVVPTAVLTNHVASQLLTKTAVAEYWTMSVFAKAAGYSNIILRLDDTGANNAQVNFDVSAGTVGVNSVSTFTLVKSSITPVGNGWYKCSILVLTNASTNINGSIYVLNSNSNTASMTGDGTSGVYLWQGQILKGYFESGGPLIPTTTASASVGIPSLVVNYSVQNRDFLWLTVANPEKYGNDSFGGFNGGDTSNSMHLNRDGGALYFSAVIGGGADYQLGITSGLIGAGRLIAGVRRLAGQWTLFGKLGSAPAKIHDFDNPSLTHTSNLPTMIKAQLGTHDPNPANTLASNGNVERTWLRYGSFNDTEVYRLMEAA